MLLWMSIIKPKTMPIAKKILNYLEKAKYSFGIIEHRKTFTAWDTAQTEKADPRTVAKALVIKADREHLLALVSSNKNLDKAKLLKSVNAKRKKDKLKPFKKIDFAKELWMKKNLPGKIGAVPPFGGLLKLPIFADAALLKNKKIYLGTGDYVSSFLIGTGEYAKKEGVVKGNFSKSKK